MDKNSTHKDILLFTAIFAHYAKVPNSIDSTYKSHFDYADDYYGDVHTNFTEQDLLFLLECIKNQDHDIIARHITFLGATFDFQMRWDGWGLDIKQRRLWPKDVIEELFREDPTDRSLPKNNIDFLKRRLKILEKKKRKARGDEKNSLRDQIADLLAAISGERNFAQEQRDLLKIPPSLTQNPYFKIESNIHNVPTPIFFDRVLIGILENSTSGKIDLKAHIRKGLPIAKYSSIEQRSPLKIPISLPKNFFEAGGETHRLSSPLMFDLVLIGILENSTFGDAKSKVYLSKGLDVVAGYARSRGFSHRMTKIDIRPESYLSEIKKNRLKRLCQDERFDYIVERLKNSPAYISDKSAIDRWSFVRNNSTQASQCIREIAKNLVNLPTTDFLASSKFTTHKSYFGQRMRLDNENSKNSRTSSTHVGST